MAAASTAAAATTARLAVAVGYSGSVRGGLCMHPGNKHLVYAIGATVVVSSIDRDRTQTFLRGHTAPISAIAVSRSGRLVASGQQSPNAGATADIVVWDWETKRPVHKLSMHKHAVAALGFSASDKYLVSLGAENDNHIIVWDMEEGKVVCGGPAHKETATCLDCLNADELRFVTGGNEHVRVWEFDPATKRITPEDVAMGHVRRNATCIAVGMEDNRAYVGTTTGDVMEIDIANKRFKSVGPTDKKGAPVVQHGIQSITLLGKGVLLCGSGAGRVLTVEAPPVAQNWTIRGKVVRLDAENVAVTSLAPMELGEHCFCGTSSGRILSLDVGSMDAKIRSTALTQPVRGIVYPHEYSELFACCSGTLVSVRNARTGKELLRIDGASDDRNPSAALCNCVLIPRDGRSIVSGWADGTVRTFLPQSGGSMYRIENAHQGGVTALADGGPGRLITGGADGQLRAWRLGKDSQTLDISAKEHKGAVTGISLTKDLSRAVTSSADGTAVVWDVPRLAPTKTLFCNAVVHGAAWGAGDTEAVCVGAERKLIFFEAASGRRIREVESGSNVALTAVALPESRSHVVVASADAKVRVFDYATGSLAALTDTHSSTALALAVAPDAASFVTACDNGACFVFSFPFAQQQQQQ